MTTANDASASPFRRPRRIALTGGIACGKSLFCSMLRDLGAEVLSADDVVHALESPGGKAADAILARFGTLDRAALAAQVFGPGRENARKDLESILFPLVRETMLAWASQCSSVRMFECSNAEPSDPPTLEHSNTRTLRISEIPLLFESRWNEDYDIIIAISSPKEIQIRRMAEMRGMSRAEAEARLAAQMPVDEKAARSDFAVRNDSTPGHLLAEAKRLMEWLKERT